MNKIKVQKNYRSKCDGFHCSSGKGDIWKSREWVYQQVSKWSWVSLSPSHSDLKVAVGILNNYNSLKLYVPTPIQLIIHLHIRHTPKQASPTGDRKVYVNVD